MGRLMRRIVAENVKLGMDMRYPGLKPSDQWEKLAVKAGTSSSTIERIVKQQTGASIDTLEDIARALKVPAPALFVASAETREALQVTLPAESALGELQRLRGRSIAIK